MNEKYKFNKLSHKQLMIVEAVFLIDENPLIPEELKKKIFYQIIVPYKEALAYYNWLENRWKDLRVHPFHLPDRPP